VALAKLTEVVGSKGVDGSRSSQEATEVGTTCDACNFVDLILQRPDNFERGMNFLELAWNLAALSLIVGAPSIEALVSCQKQIMIFACSNLQDLAVLKLRYQKRCSGTVQLPVIEAKLPKFI
jgi:hypothetical protein